MNRRTIILCEGETDQIILSYYFYKQFGYRYICDLPTLLDINSKTEFIRLYRRPDDGDEVAIWSIGGQSLFGDALRTVLEINKANSAVIYSRILIITDHDSVQENEAVWHKMNRILRSFEISGAINGHEWTEAVQRIAFDGTAHLRLLGLNIPPDEDGALETFLLEALSEQRENNYIVGKSRSFVEMLTSDMDKLKPYLQTRRLRVKAPLAVFFAIASPERVFSEMDEILKSVSWEKYKTIQRGFGLLDEFSRR